MLVEYKGNYREEAAVNYRGVSFQSGQPSKVTDEWFELNGGGNVVKSNSDVDLEAEKKAKAAAAKAAKAEKAAAAKAAKAEKAAAAKAAKAENDNND